MGFDEKETGEKYEKKVLERLEQELDLDVEHFKGNHGQPDLIIHNPQYCWDVGVEVKSCKVMVQDQGSMRSGRIFINVDAWERFSEYCQENNLWRRIIVVLYSQGLKPVMFPFPVDVVDDLALQNEENFQISLPNLIRYRNGMDHRVPQDFFQPYEGDDPEPPGSTHHMKCSDAPIKDQEEGENGT